jgi:hypothetical protein
MADDPTKEEQEKKAAAEADAKVKADADAEAKRKAEEEKNKTVPHQAFHEEREKRKALEERLKTFETEKAEAARKAEEEKGNFKKLYEDEQARAKDLESKLTNATKSLTDFETNAQNAIEESLKSVKSDEDREVVKSLLKGKSISEQQLVLPKLLEKFGSPSEINAAGKGGGKTGVTDDKSVKLDEAKKSGSIINVIKNSPAIVKAES